MTIEKFGDDCALVIVDIQNDFCKGGSLEVPEANSIISGVNALRKSFNTVVLTQDWHPSGHSSFASAHMGKNPFDQISADYGQQTLWPDHCVQNTDGADFHPDLDILDSDLIIQKGTNPNIDSYSAFYENDKKTRPVLTNGKTLKEELNQRGIKKLYFVGLAQNFCVAWNAEDACREGFKSFLIRVLSKPIPDGTEQKVLNGLKAKGVTLM